MVQFNTQVLLAFWGENSISWLIISGLGFLDFTDDRIIYRIKLAVFHSKIVQAKKITPLQWQYLKEHHPWAVPSRTSGKQRRLKPIESSWAVDLAPLSYFFLPPLLHLLSPYFNPVAETKTPFNRSTQIDLLLSFVLEEEEAEGRCHRFPIILKAPPLPHSLGRAAYCGCYLSPPPLLLPFYQV